MIVSVFSHHDEGLQPKFGALELKLEELEKWLVGAEALLSSFRVTPEDLKQFEERVNEHKVSFSYYSTCLLFLLFLLIFNILNVFQRYFPMTICLYNFNSSF